MDPKSVTIPDYRGIFALIVAILGLIVPAILIGFLASLKSNAEAWKASEITAAAGLFTSIVGTLVGAFLGVQVGATGKQEAETRANNAERKNDETQKLANQALAMLPPDQAQNLSFK